MRKRISTFVTRQFGHPSGLFGKYIGSGMAKRNVYDAQWTVSLLDIQPQQHVLEIGFGPGVSTQIVAKNASQGFVAGIDHSQTMVRAASQRNAQAIQTGRMELKLGDAASLPYPDESFDLALSLHSIYFWQNPVECLREIKRVLKPDGMLAITILPKDKWVQNVDDSVMALYFGKDLAALFSEVGYRNVRVQIPPAEDRKSLECVIGVK
ncbi:MAG TPA: class I SAM-dependent methyltransferase [Anaerolineales bacterium]|nr:class I SAM-dependent methyltransferase [Anaerolineales bacterium]